MHENRTEVEDVTIDSIFLSEYDPTWINYVDVTNLNVDCANVQASVINWAELQSKDTELCTVMDLLKNAGNTVCIQEMNRF